jgi:hypothetical protein
MYFKSEARTGRAFDQWVRVAGGLHANSARRARTSHGAFMSPGAWHGRRGMGQVERRSFSVFVSPVRAVLISNDDSGRRRWLLAGGITPYPRAAAAAAPVDLPALRRRLAPLPGASTGIRSLWVYRDLVLCTILGSEPLVADGPSLTRDSPQASGEVRWRLVAADGLLALYFMVTTLTIAVVGAQLTQSQAIAVLRR